MSEILLAMLIVMVTYEVRSVFSGGILSITAWMSLIFFGNAWRILFVANRRERKATL